MISEHMFMALVSIFFAVIDEPIEKKQLAPDVKHLFLSIQSENFAVLK